MIKSESTEQLAYDNIFDAITDDKEEAKTLKAASDKKIAARELESSNQAR